MKTVKAFSLYLGARFYFDLNLIPAFCKVLVLLLYFCLFISEKFIYLSVYFLICLDFQCIKTYLIGLYPPRLTLLFAVSAVCKFPSKIMNKLDRFRLIGIQTRCKICKICKILDAYGLLLYGRVDGHRFRFPPWFM